MVQETGLQKARRIQAERRARGEVIVKLSPVEKAHANPKSLRAAINGKCWDCTCGQRLEIARCEITDCTLHAVRPYKPRG